MSMKNRDFSSVKWDKQYLPHWIIEGTKWGNIHKALVRWQRATAREILANYYDSLTEFSNKYLIYRYFTQFLSPLKCHYLFSIPGYIRIDGLFHVFKSQKQVVYINLCFHLTSGWRLLALNLEHRFLIVKVIFDCAFISASEVNTFTQNKLLQIGPLQTKLVCVLLLFPRKLHSHTSSSSQALALLSGSLL